MKKGYIDSMENGRHCMIVQYVYTMNLHRRVQLPRQILT